MTKRLSLALLLAVLSLAPAVPARGQDVSDSAADSTAIARSIGERRRLLTECAPVGLFVTVTDYEEIGLTADRVRTMGESRLRAARLYESEIGLEAELVLTVIVFRDIYMYNANIAKRRLDPFTGDDLMTAYLPVPRGGVHGGDAGFVMQSLTETVDAIISDYLRVNEEYCQ